MSSPCADRELAESLVREAERVADRLLVVGPRLAARATRTGPTGTGPTGTGPTGTGPTGAQDAAASLARVRLALQRLADLAADAEGRSRRAVPAVLPHALGDQALVLAHDVVTACSGEPGDDAAALESALDVLIELRRSL